MKQYKSVLSIVWGMNVELSFKLKMTIILFKNWLLDLFNVPLN